MSTRVKSLAVLTVAVAMILGGISLIRSSHALYGFGLLLLGAAVHALFLQINAAWKREQEPSSDNDDDDGAVPYPDTDRELER